MMQQDHFTPEEQTMIDRLRRAPKPSLKADTLSAIQQRLLIEIDTSPIHPQPLSTPALVSVIVLTIIVVATVVVIAFNMLRPAIRVQDTPVPISSPSSTVPNAASTEEMLTEPTQAPTSASTIDVNSGSLIVIEGPVGTINGNTLTVFDVEIQVDPADPILKQIQIGKTIRVEGFTRTGSTVIVAIKVVVVVATSNSTGSIANPPTDKLPPGCKWTGKGNGKLRLKCTGK